MNDETLIILVAISNLMNLGTALSTLSTYMSKLRERCNSIANLKINLAVSVGSRHIISCDGGGFKPSHCGSE